MLLTNAFGGDVIDTPARNGYIDASWDHDTAVDEGSGDHSNEATT